MYEMEQGGAGTSKDRGPVWESISRGKCFCGKQSTSHFVEFHSEHLRGTHWTQNHLIVCRIWILSRTSSFSSGRNFSSVLIQSKQHKKPLLLSSFVKNLMITKRRTKKRKKEQRKKLLHLLIFMSCDIFVIVVASSVPKTVAYISSYLPFQIYIWT